MFFAKDQGVRQAQGNEGAKEILEARSSTKSDARTREKSSGNCNTAQGVHEKQAGQQIQSGSGRMEQ